jgi:hypothetical protein
MPTTEFHNLDIPEFLKLTKEQRAAAWIGVPTRQQAPMRVSKKQSRSDAIHTLGKTVRLRDKDHRRFGMLLCSGA